jgi:putative transposase
MIDRTDDLPISRQAKALNISRGAVYYKPRPVSPDDLRVMRRIDELHLERPFAGARMLRDFLGREGIAVGRRLSRPLMKRMGSRRSSPTDDVETRAPATRLPAHPGRDGRAPNQVWATDITYIPMARGFVYPSPSSTGSLGACCAWCRSRWRPFCVEARGGHRPTLQA